MKFSRTPIFIEHLQWLLVPIHLLASELRLPICFLLPTMHTACDSGRIRKMTTFHTLKNKIDEMTNMIDFGDFPHSL